MAVRIVPGHNQNAEVAPHRVRTVRTECLDWVLICNRRHLERVLTDYVRRYNTARPHRGIDLNPPVTSAEPPPVSIGHLRRVARADVLGGLIHEYRHAA
jgi:putative transposase